MFRESASRDGYAPSRPRQVAAVVRPGLFTSLYFSLRRPEDVHLLQFLLALPRAQQNQVLKAALRDSLPRYFRRHHPEITALSPEAVAAAVAAARRSPRHRPRAVGPVPVDTAPGQPRLAPTSGDGGRPFPQEGLAAAPSPPSEADRLQEAERKLDRLLRSLTK